MVVKGYCYDGPRKDEGNQPKELPVSTEQNTDNFRQIIEEVWNKGNLALLEELAAPGLVVHFLSLGASFERERLARHIAAMRAAFPDFTVTIEAQFSVKDKIVTRCTISGTQRGPFPNHLKILVPPTGKRFSVAGIDIWRFDANGKWVECWSNSDRLGMLQQLGAIPAAAPSTGQAVPLTFGS